MENQTSTVGRMIHYVAYGTPRGEFPALVHRAAVITEVVNDCQDAGSPIVSLCVINPTGLFFNLNVPYDASASRGGTWHWPERV